MRHPSPLRLAVALTLLAAACGSDEGQRGLTPSDEVSTPESEKELRMTEEQREQQNYQEEERIEEKEFDAAEGGGQAP